MGALQVLGYQQAGGRVALAGEPPRRQGGGLPMLILDAQIIQQYVTEPRSNIN